MAKIFCPICQRKKLCLLYPASIDRDYFDKSYKISGSDYGRHLNIYKCLQCGVVFEETNFMREKIANYYLGLYDQAYEDERQNRALAFKRIVSKIKEFKPSGKWLDVGCATGALLVEARDSGYEVYGVEPSSWASEIARKEYHLDVTTSYVEESDFPRKHFEVVTLIDVIEHLYDPKLALQKISKLIKKEGVICIVTPNIESFAAKILGEKWWHIRPSHFFYFSPKTIESLLKITDFELITFRTYKWHLSFSYLFQRFLKLLSIQSKLNIERLEKLTVGINLRDSMEVYAIKK